MGSGGSSKSNIIAILTAEEGEGGREGRGCTLQGRGEGDGQ